MSNFELSKNYTAKNTATRLQLRQTTYKESHNPGLRSSYRTKVSSSMPQAKIVAKQAPIDWVSSIFKRTLPRRFKLIAVLSMLFIICLCFYKLEQDKVELEKIKLKLQDNLQKFQEKKEEKRGRLTSILKFGLEGIAFNIVELSFYKWIIIIAILLLCYTERTKFYIAYLNLVKDQEYKMKHLELKYGFRSKILDLGFKTVGAVEKILSPTKSVTKFLELIIDKCVEYKNNRSDPATKAIANLANIGALEKK